MNPVKPVQQKTAQPVVVNTQPAAATSPEVAIVESPAIQGVKIKSQVWENANLDVAVFANGDPIPQAKSSDEWRKAGELKKPAWCYLSNDPTNGPKFGRLYNWYAVTDPRGLAPKGWHVAAEDDWRILLEITLGVDRDLKHVFKKDESGIALKSLHDWDDDGNGTDRLGFAGYPAGSRKASGEFVIVGREATWWSATEYKDGAWNYALFATKESVTRKVSDKASGFSVRLVQD